MMQITGARTEDYPRLAALWEGSVRATHDFLREEDIVFFRPLVPAFFPQVTLACARDERGIAGFVGVADGNIEMLFIDAERRGAGAGRLLLRHAVDALGAARVDVNEQNGQAVGFYERMGFVTVGRSPVDGMGKPFPLLHMVLRA